MCTVRESHKRKPGSPSAALPRKKKSHSSRDRRDAAGDIRDNEAINEEDRLLAQGLEESQPSKAEGLIPGRVDGDGDAGVNGAPASEFCDALSMTLGCLLASGAAAAPAAAAPAAAATDPSASAAAAAGAGAAAPRNLGSLEATILGVDGKRGSVRDAAGCDGDGGADAAGCAADADGAEGAHGARRASSVVAVDADNARLIASQQDPQAQVMNTKHCVKRGVKQELKVYGAMVCGEIKAPTLSRPSLATLGSFESPGFSVSPTSVLTATAAPLNMRSPSSPLLSAALPWNVPVEQEARLAHSTVLIEKIREALRLQKLQDSGDMLQQLKRNLVSSLESLQAFPGISSKMPPLPLRPNLQLATQILSIPFATV
ncbi:hypothetical protein CLOM_g9894 [Closterium sp. NIES-68]|nr:hypothetical protein CLOM_g9894 [Closterium sp. NIES-68]GJP75913.1 hypothetical protein CLOP_g6313 [Closterium sp. NIES-67]